MIFEAQMTDTSVTNEREVIRNCAEQAVYAEAIKHSEE